MSNARFSMRGPSLVAALFGRIDANNAEDVEQDQPTNADELQ